MDKRIAFFGGLGLGAGLMYLLDPEGGRRRRKKALERAGSYVRDTERRVGGFSRDLGNRARGAVAGAKARLREEEVDDAVLVERVRARLGRATSHPHAIEVSALDGYVMLRGPILAADVDQVLRAASSVRGVRSVENHLEVHRSPEGVASLQGVVRE